MGGWIGCERGRPGGAAFIVRVTFDAQEGREGAPGAGGDGEVVRVIGPRTARVEPVTAAPAAAAPAAPSSPKPTAVTRGSALVIDDEATNRRILMEILRHRGFRVVGEPSASAALEKLAAERFDVIVCDLQMPGMDGLALMARVRAEGFGGHYVAATASVRDDDPARCRAAGFDSFIRKPFRVAELDGILASIAARRAPGPLLDEAAWDAARALMGDEFAGLVSEHLELARGHVHSVRDHVDDAATVERAAHTLCSGSLMLGLAALGAAARSLETEARAMTTEQRREAGLRLAEILEATVEAADALRRDRGA